MQYPPGTVHLPDWVESDWLKQMVAEELVTVRTKRGFARLEWEKPRERNEALDCRLYTRSDAWIVAADRWSEARWIDPEATKASFLTSPVEGSWSEWMALIMKIEVDPKTQFLYLLPKQFYVE